MMRIRNRGADATAESAVTARDSCPVKTLKSSPEKIQGARGQNPSDTSQAPLEIPRATKHLVLDLPIGSKEGPYDVALITNTGDELLRATGTAELRDHITGLRVDVDLSSIRPGTYSLGLRQAGLEWSRYPIRLF
jgi:hypothetical protein